MCVFSTTIRPAETQVLSSHCRRTTRNCQVESWSIQTLWLGTLLGPVDFFVGMLPTSMRAIGPAWVSTLTLTWTPASTAAWLPLKAR